jgi:hypothetical protein
MCGAFPRNPRTTPSDDRLHILVPADAPSGTLILNPVSVLPQSNGKVTGLPMSTLPVSRLPAVVRVNRRVHDSNSVPAKRFVISAFTMSMSQSRGRRHRTQTKGVGFAFRALLMSAGFCAWLKQRRSRKQQGVHSDPDQDRCVSQIRPCICVPKRASSK